LLVSAILSAPWGSLIAPAVVLGLGALLAIFYVASVWTRTDRITEYKPDLEDLIWYTIFPLVAYAAILTGAVLLLVTPVDAMFAVGAGVLMLLIIGVRNAWDIVTFLAIEGPTKPTT
jgi:hypothetical protein